MSERTCTVDGCVKPHRAKGLCVTHYNQRQPNRHRKVSVACGQCGATCEKSATAQYAARFCSMACRDDARREHGDPRVVAWQGVSVKRDLATLRLIRGYDLSSRAAIRKASRTTWVAMAMQPRPCADCGVTYVPGTTVQAYCGDRCAKRVARRTRRSREHGASGSFTWTELMRLFLKFDRRCAYCDETIEGQPDPEHVVPLSRGGSNAVSNLLPACRACNTDKRDLSLAEWAASREARGLSPVRTTWAPDDHRFWHLSVSRPA